MHSWDRLLLDTPAHCKLAMKSVLAVAAMDRTYSGLQVSVKMHTKTRLHSRRNAYIRVLPRLALGIALFLLAHCDMYCMSLHLAVEKDNTC